MKITKVSLRNILGFEYFEFEPGAGYTEILGKNGKGKTSLAEAVKEIGKGAVHDATLLTAGKDDGEIVYVIDGDMEIRKSITADKSDIEVRVAGKKQKRPVEIIKALVDQVSCNPIELLTADKKRRIAVLLEAMPIAVDRERLKDIVGFEINEYQEGVHGLTIIDDVRKQVYDMRTGTNSAIKAKEGLISQLTEAMPEIVEGVTGGEEELEAALKLLDDEKEVELIRIGKKINDIREKSSKTQETNLTEANADLDDLQEKITELQRQYNERKTKRDADDAAEKATLKDMEGRAAQQRALTLTEHAQHRVPYESQLQTLRNDRANAAKRQATQETIDRASEELELIRQEAEAQTAAIDGIDAYKIELLSELPIPGIEIKDGNIYRDGVIFDRLNTQARAQIAIDLAKLRAGKLGVICVDGMEMMDTEHYEAFKESALLDPTLQFFITRVSDQPFEVRSNP